jgi:hypothetical protein
MTSLALLIVFAMPQLIDSTPHTATKGGEELLRPTSARGARVVVGLNLSSLPLDSVGVVDLDGGYQSLPHVISRNPKPRTRYLCANAAYNTSLDQVDSHSACLTCLLTK